MSFRKIAHHAERLRRRLDALGSRLPQAGGPDLSHLSDEELDRLERLLVRWIMQEDGPAALPHQRLSSEAALPLTEDEQRELERLVTRSQQ